MVHISGHSFAVSVLSSILNYNSIYLSFQDPSNKRSPHLVPYEKVDPHIKKCNRSVNATTPNSKQYSVKQTFCICSYILQKSPIFEIFLYLYFIVSKIASVLFQNQILVEVLVLLLFSFTNLQKNEMSRKNSQYTVRYNILSCFITVFTVLFVFLVQHSVSLQYCCIIFYRETANDVVRTLLAYGYELEPPTSELGDSMAGNRDNILFKQFIHNLIPPTIFIKG